jgi:methionyl-tRNA formyltransferase
VNSEEGQQLVERHAADLLVVCDYGEILSNQVLGLARLGGINLHGSLLPRYRGAAPVNWALLHGDTVTGITVIHMTPRLDGGPILSQHSLEIGHDEDAVELEHRLSELGVAAVMESIHRLAGWDGQSPLGEPQAKELVTKAPRLKKSDGQVDWARSAEQIRNQVRALKPWPGTFTNLLRAGKEPMRIILGSVTPIEGDSRGEHGTTLADNDEIVVRCGASDVLRIDRLQPAGKREMDGREFIRGYGTQLRFGPSG